MNNTVKLQRQCVQLGSINCESVSPALQLKVAAGALDKPQIKGMVLQVLTTDCCALLIPPGCFFFFFFLSVHVFVTAGGMRRYLQLIQAGSGHGFISSRMAHPYRPAHSQECDGSLKTELDGALFAPVWGRTKWASVLVSDRTVRSRIHKGPASCSETDTVQLDVLLVSLQCNGCFLSGHIDICEVQLTLCYTAMIGKKTPSLWVWTSDVSYQDVWNKNHNDGHSEAADFHPGVYSTLLLCPW